MDKALVVEVRLLGQVVHRYQFTKDNVVVGRDAHADVLLDHPGISRNHFRIERNDSRFSVVDSGSSNGTFLNNFRCRRALLNSGDVIQVSKYMLHVEIVDVFSSQPQEPRSDDYLTVRMPLMDRDVL